MGLESLIGRSTTDAFKQIVQLPNGLLLLSFDTSYPYSWTVD